MTVPFVLDRLFVEASSRSRAETGYTVHAGHKKNWLDNDLPLRVFSGLLAELTAVAVIRFQGWGDPLANPEILPMLAAAKKTGARVELVTDASRFTDDHANALVRDGVDQVVFTMAGLSEEANFRRRGTSLFSVLEAVSHLRTVRAVQQSRLPQIAARYTMTRSGFTAECDRLPDFLSRAGFEAASVRLLSYTTGTETEEETVVPATDETYGLVRDRLTRLVAEAADCGLRLNSRVVNGGATRFHCPDTPGSALFVAADGEVSPCPFRNVPVGLPAEYRFHGREFPFLHDVRGNLHTTPLAAIWNDPDYREFRFKHDTDTPPEGCAGCWRSFLVTI